MGILAALLTILIAVSLFILPNSRMGNLTPEELMSRNDTSVMWNALQSAISEAKTNALYPDTNYLNFTNGSELPLYGTSGIVYANIDDNASPKLSGAIAAYQTITLGAHMWRNANGTGVRNTATNYLEDGYIVAKATTCINSKGKPVAGDLSIDKVTTHSPVCALGTPVSIFAVATIDLTATPYAVRDIQYYSSGDNLGLGHNVFIPGLGTTDNDINFDDTWQAFSTSLNLDDFSVDLQNVVFRTEDFNTNFAYNQTVAGLDATATGVPAISNIIFNYNGAIDKRSVYNTLDTQGTDHTLGTNTAFKVYDANGTDYTDKVRVYLVFGRGEQIAVVPTEPEGFPEFTYTGTPGATTPDGLVDLPEADNEYVIYYAPNSISDMVGHKDTSLPTYVYFKVADDYTTTAGDPNCPYNAIHDISTTGVTHTGDASPCDNEIWNINYNSSNNTINAGTGSDTANFDGNNNTFNGGSGTDTINAGGIDSYSTGGSDQDVFSIGVASTEPSLVITDVNSDCSELLFEIYSSPPGTYTNPIDAATSGNSVILSHTILNDVEKVKFTDTQINFADACSMATISAIIYVDVNGETENGTAGPDFFVITADNAIANGGGDDDTFKVASGSHTVINGGSGTGDVAYFPGDISDYDVFYDIGTSYYYIIDAGGTLIGSSIAIGVKSDTEYYVFNGSLLTFAQMLSTL